MMERRLTGGGGFRVRFYALLVAFALLAVGLAFMFRSPRTRMLREAERLLIETPIALLHETARAADAEPWRRIAALTALSRSGEPAEDELRESRRATIELLPGLHFELRENLLLQFAHYAEPEVLAAALDLLANDPHDEVRAAAARALQSFDSPEVSAALDHSSATDRSSRVRRAAELAASSIEIRRGTPG